MSNAKKLSYEMKVPAFLQRLRASAAGAQSEDRYIAPRNRKVAVNNDDDAPAYVLEDGQDISREEFEKLQGAAVYKEDGLEKPTENVKEKLGSNSERDMEGGKEKEKNERNQATVIPSVGGGIVIAEVGRRKKRKAGRMIGNGKADDIEDGEDKGAATGDGEDGRESKKQDSADRDGGLKAKGKAPGKAKRRVKLSFCEE